MASVESKSSSPYSKFACILVTSFTVRKSEWYAFDVSDDPEHNQSPPPPPVAPIYRRYAKYLLAPFHEEDKSDDNEHGASFTLKPKATATSDYDCCWGILGSKHTLYRIRDTPERDGSRDLEKPNLVDRINLIGGDSKWESVATMPNRIPSGHRGLVLNGKLYLLGGYPASINADGSREEVESKPWAMAYDPTTNVWESIPNPHVVPISYDNFSAALDVNHKPRILLGAPLEQMLQIYHADTKTWEQQEFVICDRRILHPQDLANQAPLAVDNKLYWYAVDTHCLVGYDLDAKMWFQGYLPMHDHDGYLKDEEHPHRGRDSPPCLGHVGGGENFCLLWVSLLPPTSPALPPIPDNYKSRIHCMKFRVTTGGNPSPDSAVFPLEISILSCQSYLVSGAKEFVDGLVVDGHLGSYDCSSESSRPFGG